MTGKQPKIKIEASVSEKFIELVVAFLAIVIMIYATFLWIKLPGTIPTRFGTNGQVIGYGSKNVILSLIPVIVILYIVLTLLQRIPHIYSYVVKITEENAEHQYRIAVSLMRMLKIEILALFTYLYIITILSAKEGTMVFGLWFLLITFIVMPITIGVYISKSIKSK